MSRITCKMRQRVMTRGHSGCHFSWSILSSLCFFLVKDTLIFRSQSLMNVWICVSSKLARNLRLRIYFTFSALRVVNQSTSWLWPPSIKTVNAMLKPSLFPESLYWGLKDSQGHFRCFISTTCCIFISCLLISSPTCWFFLWKCYCFPL